MHQMANSFPPESADFRQAAHELGQAVTDFADISLADKAVTVRMRNIVAGIALPDGADAAFRQVGLESPDSLDSVSIEVGYDRFEQQFNILSGLANFNNRSALTFSKPYLTPSHGVVHNLGFVQRPSPDERREQQIGIVRPEIVHFFFNSTGVDLPVAPAHATWETIGYVAGLAESQELSAHTVTPCNVNQEVRIEDHVILSQPRIISDEETAHSNTRFLGKSAKAQDEFRYDASRFGWMRETSLRVTDFRPQTPVCLEAVFRSTEPGKSPDLTEVTSHVLQPNSNMIFHTTESLAVEPDIRYLDMLSQAIDEASF